MANTTKVTTAILFQASVALAFFLALYMGRNTVDHEEMVPRTLTTVIELDKPIFPGFSGISSMPSTELSIPDPGITECSESYKVKKGETCYWTYTRFNVTEETFYALNPRIDCNNLDIGQALCIAGKAD